jgi:hypothetical protein
MKFKIYKSRFTGRFTSQDFPWIVKLGDKEVSAFHSWNGAMRYVRIKLGSRYDREGYDRSGLDRYGWDKSHVGIPIRTR